MAGIRSGFAAAAVLVLLAPSARAQGVAFQPIPGTLLEGPLLNVTPAVSIDRRYVRLGINAQFIGDVGFNTYMVPAAVGGGPGGPGALGGIGAGGAGAGAGGGQFLAGMNGVIDPWQGAGSSGFAPGFGFMANPPIARAPAVAAPPAVAAVTAAPQPKRMAPPKTRASKALQNGRNSRARAKHPASAAAPTSSTGNKAGAGP